MTNDYCLQHATIDWPLRSVPQARREGDIYWSFTGGLDEKRHVYIEGNGLPERFSSLKQSSFQVFELGFGFGLNFLLTASAWSHRAQPGQILHYVAVERAPVAPADLRRLLQQITISNKERLTQIYPAPVAGLHTLWFQPNVCLHLYLGDARSLLADGLLHNIDCIFLDGFAPIRNPDAWDPWVLKQLALASRSGATLCTYSVAGHVRRNLQAAGFQIQRRPGYGQKREMLHASLPPDTHEGTPLTVAPVSVAVIGGGLAGHQVARALSRRGIQPTIFDNGGIRLPMYALSPQVALNVNPESRLSLLGTQFTNNHLDVQRIGLQRKMSSGRRQRVLASLHPDVASDCGNGLLYTHGGFLYGKDLFTDETNTPDNRIQRGQVLDVVEQSDRVVVTFQPIHSPSTQIDNFDHVYIAAPDRALTVLSPVPLTPVWGQSVVIQADSTIDGPVIADGASIIPGPDGFQVSATYDRDRHSQSDPRYQDTEVLVHHFRRSHPDTRVQSIRAITGQRTTTPDRVPVAGPAPDWQALGAYCADNTQTRPFQNYSDRIGLLTGFGSHGTTLAPLLAEFLVASMMKEPTVLTRDLMTVLLPSRFLLRQVGRLQTPL